MTPLGNELSNLRDHLLQVAALLRSTPTACDLHHLHAKELEGASAICREWCQAISDQPAQPPPEPPAECGTCRFWSQIPPDTTQGHCLWVMHQNHPWWLAKIKTMEYWQGSACRAYERNLPPV